ncbi:MAG: hypothetical protein AB2812_08300 [Candidatus Sedimenticola endophacoides]
MPNPHRLLPPLLLLLLLFAPTAPRADTLDTVIDVVLYAVDPGLAESRPLVKCLAQGHSASTCAEQYAEQQANQAVADAMASDPKVRLIVDIVTAANAGKWIDVLELTGTDLLVQIACSAGMPGGGPVKSFVCSGLFGQVAGLAKPVVREILVAIKHKDWMRLVALAGPDLACEIIPTNDPLSGTLCSVPGEVIGAVGGALSDAAGAIVDKVGDLINGESPHISYDEYYARKFSLLPFKRAQERIVNGRQGLGLDPGEWNPCVSYFDDHQQKRDTAEKTCNDLGRRLHHEAEVLADYVATLPQTHFDAHIRPLVKDRTAELMMSDGVEAYKVFVDQLPPGEWTRLSFLTGRPAFFDFQKGESLLFDIYQDCAFRMDDMIYGQGQGVVAFPGMTPESLLEWGCYQAAGKQFAEAMIMERLRILISVQPQLVDTGCDPRAANAQGSIVFKCNNHSGFALCRDAFKGYRQSHCSTDMEAASRTMGEEIAALLGARRCTYAEASKYEAFDPRVVCTRPWKRDQCEHLLAQKNAASGLPTKLDCKYMQEADFNQAQNLAREILQALNSVPTEETQPPG